MANGLLSDALSNPLLHLGAGLLSQAGPSFQPPNIGRGLLTGLQSASQAQRAALANQLARQQLTARQRQAQAQQRLAGQLGGGGNAQLLGLLAQAAPEQFAQGLLGQVFPARRAEPADIRSLRAVGIDPTSDEGRQIIVDRLTREGGTLEELDGLLKALNIQKITEDLQQGRREDLREERAGEVALLGTVQAVTEMAELNEELEGTLGETGIPFADARRAALAGGGALGRLTGIGGADLTDLAAKLDRFDKLATEQVIRAAAEARISGAFTNRQLQAFQAAKPGTAVTPEANRQILADMLELSLSAADARDVTVRDRDQKEQLIRELRGETAQPSTMQDVISSLTGRQQPRRATRVIDFNELPE